MEILIKTISLLDKLTKPLCCHIVGLEVTNKDRTNIYIDYTIIKYYIRNRER